MAVSAPPLPVVDCLGAVSSRTHMVITAPRGRSWLIREPTSRVMTTVITSAHATLKKPKPIPIRRSTVRVRKNTARPMPQETYRARHGNVALGGPSQTASTR
ncbi:hypothetical protein [Kutzneria sp. 744]|uniref:hypothetical protein n=1 Tax=Kutzneria sp. (strain 744) TaxID=345341 RepID=UPI0005B8B1FC